VNAQRIVLLIGLPGSGKSTWATAQGWNALSSDAMRVLLSDDVANQHIHGRVFAAIRYLLRQRLRTGCAINCVDATHLTRAERRPYFSLARWHKAVVEAVYFDIPFATVMARNRARQRQVPEAAIATMAARMEPPQFEEGFHSIRCI
jgi:predicted kinase